MRKSLAILAAALVVLCACQPKQHKLVILHLNDTHSHFEPLRSGNGNEAGQGGVIERAAYIDSVRVAEGEENVLLLHAGDFSQGTSYFTQLGGDLEIATINAMRYDVVTLGNHEFDNGIEDLARRLSVVNCPVVCANYDFSPFEAGKYIKPYTIVEKAGRKIGIFGLGVNLDGYTAPQTAREVTYLDSVETARRMVAELKALNCNLIVCLSHVGVDTTIQDNDFEIARQVPEIDVIIGGHSHEEINPPAVVGNTRICQMTNRGKCFGVLTVER